MTIKDFWGLPNEESLVILNKIKEEKGELPPDLKILYEIREASRIKNLPPEERFRIFLNSKEEWCEHYPDFKRISDVMQNFKTDEMLIEFSRQSPPPSTRDKAVEVYKKCISFKEKLTKKILSHLIYGPDTPSIHYHRVQYCIDENKVKSFLHEYQSWNRDVVGLWNEVYYLNQDFFHNSGYDRTGWDSYIKYPTMLNEKAAKVERLHENTISLLIAGTELVLKHDAAITLEYETNALEMSLYERENEIARTYDDASDEEYCYVYTLECDLFVFYVGIAANPQERFEQHVRGAFSDEAHLFKSKFIQKYHPEVKQNLIFEGTRRECKKIERDYISKFSPLGNMTEGGEG